MLHLADYQYVDVARELDRVVELMILRDYISGEVGEDAVAGDPCIVHADHVPVTQTLREAVERIYEVCQTAHARELRKSSAASTNSLDNDSALT